MTGAPVGGGRVVAGSFSVDPTALGGHAALLEGAGGRLGEASAAAGVAMSPDAYGEVCGFLADATVRTADRLRAVIDGLAGTMTAHADAVRGCLADYQAVDGPTSVSLGGAP